MLEDGSRTHQSVFTNEEAKDLVFKYAASYKELESGSKFIDFKWTNGKFRCTKCSQLFGKHPFHPDVEPQQDQLPSAQRARAD